MKRTGQSQEITCLVATASMSFFDATVDSRLYRGSVLLQAAEESQSGRRPVNLLDHLDQADLKAGHSLSTGTHILRYTFSWIWGGWSEHTMGPAV